MSELDTLRPEVREAVAAIDGGNGVFVNADDCIGSEKWKIVRAELLRLAHDNDALRAEVERLRAFALELLGDHPELGNWDGFDLQELAVKHGLMRQKVPAPTEPCGEGCVCGEYYSGQEFRDGDVQCYVLTIPRSPLPEPPAERGEG